MSSAILEDDPTLGEEDLPVPEHLLRARAVLVRGLRESPELRTGLALTAVISLGATLSGLMGPILIQQIFDHGFSDGFRASFVYSICTIALALLAVSYFAGRSAGRRLVRTSERALTELRTRTFAHIHDLSLAEQSRERRGVFVARVTADIDTLSKFTEWGMVAWIVAVAQIAGSLALMLVYSWQLTVPVVLLVVPLIAIMLRMQKTLSAAFDLVRTTVGQMLSEVSESVMGAGVVRAYGLDESTDVRVKHSIDRRYRAQVAAHLRAATMFPVAAVFWGFALSVVVVFGTTFGPSWGLTFGRTVAFLFLADLFLRPFVDLPEIYTQTQTAISGWRKVLALLDMPIEIVEPLPGRRLRGGPVAVHAERVSYSYAPGRPVVRDVDVLIEAGAHVAIVGQTGSGKTTFAKLLARLADPDAGRILLDGIDLRDVDPAARRGAVRMVPQDGFLFDLTVLENIRAGCEGGSDDDVVTAIEELGLDRLGRDPARRVAHARRPTRRVALRRGAPARLIGAGPGRQPGVAHPRRGHQLGRPGDGATSVRSPSSTVRRPDHRDDRTSALDGGGCRLDPGVRPRAYRRAWHARKAHRDERRLRPPARELARQRRWLRWTRCAEVGGRTGRGGWCRRTSARSTCATSTRIATSRRCTSLGATVAMINTSGIIASYPTALPFHTPSAFLQGDDLPSIIGACHAAGIKVIARTDFSKVRPELHERHPEWASRRADGTTIEDGGDVHVCPSGSYQRECAPRIVEETITVLDVDGIYFNMAGFQTWDYRGVDHGTLPLRRRARRASGRCAAFRSPTRVTSRTRRTADTSPTRSGRSATRSGRSMP